MHKERPEIKNNIIAGGEDGIFITYRDGALFDTRKSLTRHNDVCGGGHAYWLDEDGVTFDLTGINGNISDDPLFKDAQNGDFSLDDDSPCKGKADDGGDMGARISLLPPPSPPVISGLPQVTNERYISISGTKDINTSIIINGIEVIPPNSNTEWLVESYDLGLEDGNKTLIFASRNIYCQESAQVTASVELDRTPPHIAITSPVNGAILDEAPIAVTGTVDDAEAYVDVNGVFAGTIGSNTFAAEGIDLRYGQNTITAAAIDEAGNIATDDIIVTSTTTSVYELIKITQDTYYGDPDNPVAGSNIELRVKLVVEEAPKASEPIQFTITAGNGTLSPSITNTDTSGEAYVTLTTDTNVTAVNSVEAYAVNFPNKKVIFSINAKPGQGTQLIKITDDTITPVPSTTMPLIVKLIDANNNPIDNQTINFTITQGGGSLSAVSAVTNYYGEAKSNLTLPNTSQSLTKINVACDINPSITTMFNITTSSELTVTFDDIMNRVKANENKILDLMADAVTASNNPSSSPQKLFKLWVKGNKSKVEYSFPTQNTFIITTTPTSINIGGEQFLEITEESDPNITKTDTIESQSGDMYVLKTVITSSNGFEEITRYYVDYQKGVITKTQDEYRDDYKKEFVEMDYSYIYLTDTWVTSEIITKEKNFAENTEYTTTETRSNIVINSGIPDSIFQ